MEPAQSSAQTKIDFLLDNKVLVAGKEILKSDLEKAFAAQLEEGVLPCDKKDVVLREATKEIRIRIGTLLKTDNVALLIGAGCSLDAGGVSLRYIPFEIERDILNAGIAGENVQSWLVLFYEVVKSFTPDRDFKPKDRHKKMEEIESEIASSGEGSDKARKIVNDFLIRINFETFLTRLYSWQDVLNGDVSLYSKNGSAGSPLSEISKRDVDDLLSHLLIALVKRCQLPSEAKIGALDVYRNMVKKLLARPLNLRRTSVFTLNYDTMVEQATDAEGIILIDGFAGTLKRIFRPESFEQDLYFPAKTTEGSVRRLDNVIHLYKLHGSITWHTTEPDWDNPYGLYATYFDDNSNVNGVLIFPTPLKYDKALGLPYSELFRRFACSIIQPQSVLFVIGYSFGDGHLNALIRQAFAIPSFTLVIVDPNPNNAFVEQLQRENDQRVWIIRGDEIGKFGGFVEYLLPDLREEEMLKRVVSTFRSLDPKSLDPAHLGE